MKNVNSLAIALVASFGLAAFTSCMTEQKATNYLENRGQLARICSVKFPPIVFPGSLITKSDTVIVPGERMPCPAPRIDTVTGKPEIVYVQCPPNKIIRGSIQIHDTIIDNALAHYRQHQNDSLSIELRQSIAATVKARKQAGNRLSIIIGICVIFVAGVAFKLKSII